MERAPDACVTAARNCAEHGLAQKPRTTREKTSDDGPCTCTGVTHDASVPVPHFVKSGVMEACCLLVGIQHHCGNVAPLPLHHQGTNGTLHSEGKKSKHLKQWLSVTRHDVD